MIYWLLIKQPSILRTWFRYFIYKSVPIILEKYEWESVFGKLGFTLILILWIIRTIFNALRDYLKLKPRYSDKPIDSFIQVIMIISVDSGYHYYISRLFEIGHHSFTTFGAVSALIILIFGILF
jgi:miniconductance mechanosensitive channel